MGKVLLIIAALVVLVCSALLALFGTWMSKSWTVIEDDEAIERKGDVSLWRRLGGWAGRGPRRLTYRRDERGRFRKHRR